jgi:FkbM family methyltransferase
VKTAYQIARNSYQAVLNRSERRARRQGREFYRPFVRRGDLVFDIGANVGHVSEMFLELGCRAVAVEPNPALAELISRHYGRQVAVVEAACGREEGSAELHLGTYDGHSTLSEEWLDKAPAGHEWRGQVSVHVTTIERLEQRSVSRRW